MASRSGSDAWLTRWAPTDDELSACVECGLCLPHCPTFRLTGDEAASPRGRLNAMSAVARGEHGIDAAFDEVMSFCLQCRACEAACPSLVPFGRAMEGARAELAVARPTFARRVRHRIVGSWVRRPRLIRLLGRLAALSQRVGAPSWLPGRLGRGLRGLRRLPLRSPRRTATAAVDDRSVAALLDGCVAGAWFPGLHDATIAVLEAIGFRVVVSETQTCCGALAAHEGAAAQAGAMARQNVAAFAEADVIISNTAGCTAHLRSYGDWSESGAAVADRSRDIVEVAAEAIEAGRLPKAEASGRVVAVQDPCHHRHALRLVTPSRVLLEAAGFTPIDADPDGMCCGAAGMYAMVRPATSKALGSAIAQRISRSDADLVASANPGCEMQLRAHLPRGTPIAHPIEIYAKAVGLQGE